MAPFTTGDAAKLLDEPVYRVNDAVRGAGICPTGRVGGAATFDDGGLFEVAEEIHRRKNVRRFERLVREGKPVPLFTVEGIAEKLEQPLERVRYFVAALIHIGDAVTVDGSFVYTEVDVEAIEKEMQLAGDEEAQLALEQNEMSAPPRWRVAGVLYDSLRAPR